MLSLLFKQTLLWLNAVSSWTAGADTKDTRPSIPWHGVRKCLSGMGSCAELQQGSRPWDLLPAPLRLSRTSAWALGGLDLALGNSVCPTEHYPQVSCWPRCSHPVSGRHIDPHNGRVWGGQKPHILPGWGLFIWRVMLGELLHRASDTLGISPAYITFSVLTVLGQGVSAAQWHDGHGRATVLVPHDAERASTGLGNESPLSFYRKLNSLVEEQHPSRLWFDIPCSCKACSAIENSVPLR